MRPLDSARRFLFGDDVFISYSRQDGADYALALAGRLTRDGLSCFLDQWGTRSGEEVPSEVLDALRRSTMLVLVGTEGAAASDNVGLEIEKFLPTKQPIIPITFIDGERRQALESLSSKEALGTIANARWYPQIKGMALTIESLDTITTHVPSSNVLDRIVNAEGFTRRNKRLRNVFWSTLGAVIVLIAIAGFVVKDALDRQAQARKEVKVAQQQAIEAAAARDHADAEAKAATTLRDKANLQRLSAEQQQRRSLSERLAIEAESSIEAFPQRGLALATLAAKTFADHRDSVIVSAEQALWNALSRNGGLAFRTPTGIRASATSADGRWLATAGANEVLLWDLRRGTPARSGVLPLDLSDRELQARTRSTNARAALAEDLETLDDAAREKNRIERSDVAELVISADSRWLLARMKEYSQVWDLRAASPAKTSFILPHDYEPTSMAGFTPNSRWAVRVGNSSATAWDLTSRPPGTKSIQLGDSPPTWAELSSYDFEHYRVPAPTRDLRWLGLSNGKSPPALLDLVSADPTKTAIVLAGSHSFIKHLAVSANRQWAAGIAEERAFTDESDEQPLASTAYLWRLNGPETGPPIALKGHAKRILTLAFSPDGCWLATGSVDRTARLWRVSDENPSEKPVVLERHAGAVTHLAFSPDGKWIATGGEDIDERGARNQSRNNVHLRRVGQSSDWHNLTTEPGHLADLVFSPDSDWLAARVSARSERLREDERLPEDDPPAEDDRPGAIGQTINLWRTWDFDGAVLRGHESPVAAVGFTPDNQWLFSGAGDGLRFWRISGRRNWFAMADTINVGRGRLVSMSLSPDGRWLTTIEEYGETRLWDLQDRKCPYTTIGFSESNLFHSVVFTQDGHWLVVANESGPSKETARFALRLYDLRLRDPASDPIPLTSQSLSTLAVSSDSRWLVTAGDDQILRLWDLYARNPAKTSTILPGYRGYVHQLEITRDGRWIAIYQSGGAVRLWKFGQRGVEGKPIDLRDHRQSARQMTISADGRWLAIVDVARTARLWDLSSSDPNRNSRAIACDCEWLDFSPDSRWVWTSNYRDLSSGDFETSLWDVSDTRHPVAKVQTGGYPFAAFSADSQWLVTNISPAPDDELALWDLSKQPMLASPVTTFHRERIAFSPDSRWLLSANQRWDLHSNDITTSRIELPVMSPPETSRTPFEFKFAAPSMFTPDSRTVLLGVGNWVSFYPLQFDDLMATATHTVYRNLSPDEWRKIFIGEPYRKPFPTVP